MSHQSSSPHLAGSSGRAGGLVMTHTRPSHLQWTHSIGNRPETHQPAEGCQTNEKPETSPTLLPLLLLLQHLNQAKQTWWKHVNYRGSALTSSPAHALLMCCSAMWVKTLWMARSPTSGYARHNVATPAAQQSKRLSQSEPAGRFWKKNKEKKTLNSVL